MFAAMEAQTGQLVGKEFPGGLKIKINDAKRKTGAVMHVFFKQEVKTFSMHVLNIWAERHMSFIWLLDREAEFI